MTYSHFLDLHKHTHKHTLPLATSENVFECKTSDIFDSNADAVLEPVVHVGRVNDTAPVGHLPCASPLCETPLKWHELCDHLRQAEPEPGEKNETLGSFLPDASSGAAADGAMWGNHHRFWTHAGVGEEEL